LSSRVVGEQDIQQVEQAAQVDSELAQAYR
jgi:hypothetical protein